MAGIGFELRKLYHESGMFRHLRAYAYSSTSTVGPMALSIGMVAGIQYVMSLTHTATEQKELFLATIVYAFIFSILVTAGISMLLTRFLADMLFQKKYEHALSSYYGAAAVCLPIGAVVALIFLSKVEAGVAYKAAAFLLFMELILIWIQSVHLSALKDYRRIFRSFMISGLVALLGAWMIGYFSDSASAAGMLAAVDLGFFIALVLTNRHFEQVFPKRNAKLYFSFLSYFRKYPSLFIIGTLLYAGVYLHSFVYWLGPYQYEVAGRFLISPFYDTPVFYSYFSVLPTLIVFAVAVETNFYDKFRSYYDLVRQRGTWEEIATARKDMQRSLSGELKFLMVVQLMFTLFFLILGIKVLPMLGLSVEQIHVYILLLAAYYLFIMTFVILLLLLYYDDRKGVMAIVATFLVLNVLLSAWTMNQGWHGIGMLIASAIVLLLALGRTYIYVRSIDYHTFCAQPLTPVGAKSGRSITKNRSGKAVKFV